MAILGGLLPSGYETLEDANGVTVPGGLIWTYAAGTTTPQATYTDPNLGTPNTNPIIADGSGRWLAYAAFGTGFKLVFETPAVPPTHGATLKTCDNIVSPLTQLPTVDTGGVTYIVDSTATGAVNDYVLVGRTKSTVWQWVGAADLALTGISGGAIGHVLTIRNASGTANRKLTLAQASGSSLPVNQFFNAVTSAPTPLGPGGWASYAHNGSGWILISHCQGAPLSAPFNAANYGAVGGATWTIAAGNVTGVTYEVRGRTLTVMAAIEGSSVAVAVATSLQIFAGAWAFFTPASPMAGGYTAFIIPGSIWETGGAYCTSGFGLDRIALQRSGGASWPVGGFNVYATLQIPIV
jgi:hypothetical protein